ncbi:polysaccharide deacetylase family protein [Pradoshia sp.]
MRKSILFCLLAILLLPGEAFAKTAYLSFDDGPSNCTEPILDILDIYDVKATFFVTATKEKSHHYLYKEMVNRGHALGLHSYSHKYSSIYRSTGAFYADIDKLEEFLRQEVGSSPNILRFPGGSNNYINRQYAGTNLMPSLKEEAKKRGYTYFDWNCDANDGMNPPVPEKKIISLLMNSVQDKENLYILLHDFNGNMTVVDGLPEIIRRLKHKGYTFKVMDETTPILEF